MISSNQHSEGWELNMDDLLDSVVNRPHPDPTTTRLMPKYQSYLEANNCFFS